MINQLYHTQFHKMVRTARQYVGFDAEDIVQESFIKMIEYQHLDYTDAVKLLTVTVRNKCIDTLRRKKVKDKLVRRMPPQKFHHEIKLRFEAEDMRRYLGILAPRSRTCVELRYLEGLRVKDIAQILNVDHSSVSINIRRGLDKLKTVV